MFVKQLKGNHAKCEKEDADKSKRTHDCKYEEKRGKFFDLFRCMRNRNSELNTMEPLKNFLACLPTSEIGKNQILKRKRKRADVDHALQAVGVD